MKKQLTAFLTACAFLMQFSSFSASANTPIITISPGNMVFLDVVHPDGSSAENVKVHLYNAAGTEIGCLRNDNYFSEQNNSGVTSTEIGKTYSFTVPWNSFTPYAAPETLYRIDVSHNEDMSITSCNPAGSDIWVSSGTPCFLNLYSYNAAEATALTVPANYFGVYVDPKWANRTAVGYVTTPALTLYFNRSGSFDLIESLTTVPTGETRLYEAFSPTYAAKIGLDYENGGGSVSSSPVEISSVQTEYVLCRLPLQQLCPHFNADGTYESDGLLYDLTKDTANTHALLVIQSGAMLSAVIPDQNGYVEFYLDKATREFALDYGYDYCNIPNEYGTVSGGGSGFGTSGTAGTLTKLIVEPVSIPKDEVILTNVPAGTYTLTYENLPEGYVAPKTATLTVTDSQEVQYLRLMLEEAPLLGDVNCDKQINAADAALVLQAASAIGSGGASGLTAEQETAADVNGNGTFDAVDAALILQYAAYIGSGGTMSLTDYLAAL